MLSSSLWQCNHASRWRVLGFPQLERSRHLFLEACPGLQQTRPLLYRWAYSSRAALGPALLLLLVMAVGITKEYRACPPQLGSELCGRHGVQKLQHTCNKTIRSKILVGRHNAMPVGRQRKCRVCGRTLDVWGQRSRARLIGCWPCATSHLPPYELYPKLINVDSSRLSSA